MIFNFQQASPPALKKRSAAMSWRENEVDSQSARLPITHILRVGVILVSESFTRETQQSMPVVEVRESKKKKKQNTETKASLISNKRGRFWSPSVL